LPISNIPRWNFFGEDIWGAEIETEPVFGNSGISGRSVSFEILIVALVEAITSFIEASSFKDVTFVLVNDRIFWVLVVCSGSFTLFGFVVVPPRPVIEMAAERDP